MNRVMVGALSAALFVSSAAALEPADGPRAEPAGFFTILFGGRDFAPITNERYRTECGSCHFAYPPGLLPADAWQRITESLDDHFGDDASMDPALAEDLRGYLSAQAANVTRSIRSRAFAAAPISGEGPPRITETVYFRRHHDLVPSRLVKENPEVGSFTNCQKCHRGAEQGIFNPSTVEIPGASPADE